MAVAIQQQREKVLFTLLASETSSPATPKSVTFSPLSPPSSAKSRTNAIRRASSILGLRSLASLSSLRGLAQTAKARDSTTQLPIDEDRQMRVKSRDLSLPLFASADHDSRGTVGQEKSPAVRIPFLGDVEVKSLKGHDRCPSTETQLLRHYERQYQVDDDMDATPVDEGSFFDSPRGRPPIRTDREMYNHPGPLNSNPPISDQETPEADNANARTVSNLHDNISFASEWQSVLGAFRQSTGTLRPPLQADVLESSTFPGHDPIINAQITRLHSPLDPLKTANNALLTLVARHEGTIEAHKAMIEEYEATVARQETAIAELNRQLRSKDAEQSSLVGNFCAELASCNDENAALRGENMALKSKVEKLQQVVAKVASSVFLDGEGPTSPKNDSEHNVIQSVAFDAEFVDQSLGQDDGFVSPVSTNNDSSGGGAGSPDTLPTSCNSPRSCAASSLQDLYAVDPISCSMHVPSTYSSSTRRGRRKSHQLSISIRPYAAPIGADEQHTFSPHLESHVNKSSLGPQLTALTSARSEFEQDLVSARERIEAAEHHRNQLEERAASQAVLIEQLTRAATNAALASAPLSIPDLPVLTYTKSALIWLDRLSTSLRYLGLVDFIRRDMPQPDTSTADIEQWTLQRLRTAVLIKQAIDDEILEDVLYLASRKDTSDANSQPAAEDPYWLLKTILTLRRTLPICATDLTWIDRIENTDFDDIHGFASLVLCIDRRHGLLYGTSVDHYDAMLPKIQESLEKRFPDVEKSSLMGDPFGSSPAKWRQLPTWMSKMIKKKSASELSCAR